MTVNLYYFRPFAQPSVLRRLSNSYHLIPLEREGGARPEWELPALMLADAAHDDMARLAKVAPKDETWRVIFLLDGEKAPPAKLDQRVFAVLPRKFPGIVLERTVASACETLRSLEERRRTRHELHDAVSELETLNKIGVALSTERNTDSLLELILTKSREITSCDAGSLYLVEEEPAAGKHLVFRLTQSDSHSVPFRQFTLPIGPGSMAGYAAATGQPLNIKDAYRIRNLPFRHNREFDEKFGYRTKSILVVPMKNQKDEVIGVLQLINAKKHREVKLTSRQVVREEVIPFSKRSQELAASLASQAAVALENNLLYQQIQTLFEGFVKASVKAIEARDPPTSGHSERVAKLTDGLAKAVDRSDSGPYKDVHFTLEELQELKYASLLHDFGKVGVREDVLVKEKKLKPYQLDLIKERFLYMKRGLEAKAYCEKLDYVLRNGNQSYQEFFGQVDVSHSKRFQTLDEFLQHILKANEPTVLPEKTSDKLLEIANWSFEAPSGLSKPLLNTDELKLLSISKGTLDDNEVQQIQSHVIHSFHFLSRIPWTKELENIPEIVRAHHERLNGSGYPYHMKSEQILPQSKMMAIADVFDALTARDRQYKKAVPIAKALDIIGSDVNSQLLDPDLFHLFVDAKIYELTAKD